MSSANLDERKDIEIAQQAKPTREELLVNGFIRGIKSIMDENVINIPHEIILLCLLFYPKPLQFITIPRKPSKRIQIFNADNKQTLTLLHDTTGNTTFDAPLYYIHNISMTSVPETLKVSHDGILCYKPPKGIVLLSFDSKAINNQQEFIKYQETSVAPFKIGAATHGKILPCGKYGLIHPSDYDLIQLKMDDIGKKVENAQEPFAEYGWNAIDVKPEDQIWDFESEMPQFSPFAERFLSVTYLPNKAQIFAIYHEKWCFVMNQVSKIGQEQVHECGIFDLEKKKWRQIAPLKYEKGKDNDARFECCLNENDENILYAVSNTGNTQRYDFEKDEWCELVKDGTVELLGHILWMNDAYTLCSLLENGYVYGSLDLRKDHPKWNVIKEWIKPNRCMAKI